MYTVSIREITQIIENKQRNLYANKRLKRMKSNEMLN